MVKYSGGASAIRLVDYERVQARDRTHFLAIAAQAMRRILIERARSRRSNKRRSTVGVETPSTFAVSSIVSPRSTQFDEALQALSTIDPRKAQLVELGTSGADDRGNGERAWRLHSNCRARLAHGQDLVAQGNLSGQVNTLSISLSNEREALASSIQVRVFD
jgi:hypothetical protein